MLHAPAGTVTLYARACYVQGAPAIALVQYIHGAVQGSFVFGLVAQVQLALHHGAIANVQQNPPRLDELVARLVDAGDALHGAAHDQGRVCRGSTGANMTVLQWDDFDGLQHDRLAQHFVAVSVKPARHLAQ